METFVFHFKGLYTGKTTTIVIDHLESLAFAYACAISQAEFELHDQVTLYTPKDDK